MDDALWKTAEKSRESKILSGLAGVGDIVSRQRTIPLSAPVIRSQRREEIAPVHHHCADGFAAAGPVRGIDAGKHRVQLSRTVDVRESRTFGSGGRK